MQRIAFISTALVTMLITLAACAGANSVPEESKQVKVDEGAYIDISPAKLNPKKPLPPNWLR